MSKTLVLKAQNNFGTIVTQEITIDVCGGESILAYDADQTSINLAFTTRTGFAKEKLSNAEINALFYSSNMRCPITGHEIMAVDSETGAYGPWTNTTYIGMNWYQDVEVVVRVRNRT